MQGTAGEARTAHTTYSLMDMDVTVLTNQQAFSYISSIRTQELPVVMN